MNRMLVVICLLGLIVACASQQERSERPGEVYLRYAGEPVEQVSYSSVRGWQPVGDEALLVDFGARGHYLIEIGLNCRMDIVGATSIGLETRMRGLINRFDHVLIGGKRCMIQEIRPVDYQAARAEMRGQGAEDASRSISEQVLESEEP